MNGASWLLDTWVRDFAQVLEMMTAQPCKVSWTRADGAGSEPALWWKQEFSVAPGHPLLIGAPAGAWSQIGAQVLKAAGIEMFEQSEARNTYVETVQQSLSSVATALSSKAGRTVELIAGEIVEIPVRDGFLASIEVLLGDATCTMRAVVTPGLGAALGDPAAARETPSDPAGAAEDASAALRMPGMDFLLDVELPVSISFGQAKLPLKDVLKLTTGSVVELDQQPEEPVDVIVNKTVVARGEVVVVEGNYGVRITQIVSRQNRMLLRHQETTPHQRIA